MKLYIVFNEQLMINHRSNNYFLVKASSKREAVSKVFEEHLNVLSGFWGQMGFVPFYKKNFWAISVEEALKHSDVFCIE